MPSRNAPPRIPGTTRIVLHGALRAEFGGPFDWGCNTPACAIYALIVNKPGFRQAMEQGQYRVIRGKRRCGMDLDENMLRIRFPAENPEFHIIPVAAGAGGNSGGILKIVLGVVLIGAAIATGVGAFGGTAIGGTVKAGTAVGLHATLFGVSAGAIGLFGAGMLLGGIGDILSRQPKPPAQRASFLLSGPLNTATEGGPVPLAYGILVRTGSTMISTGYQAVALNASGQASYGGTGGSGGSFDNLLPANFQS